MLLVAEIKPSHAKRIEVQRGVGQAVQYLPERNVKSILVIPTTYADLFLPVFLELDDRVGLLGYHIDNLVFVPLKCNWQMDDSDISWLEETETNIPSRKNRWESNRFRCLKCGHTWTWRRRGRPQICPKCFSDGFIPL
jgi:hypothetical protein